MNRRRRIEISLGFTDIRRHDRLIDGASPCKLCDLRAMRIHQSQGVILINLVSGQVHRIMNRFIPGIFVRVKSGYRIIRAILPREKPINSNIPLHHIGSLRHRRRCIIRLGDGGIFLHHCRNGLRCDLARHRGRRKGSARRINTRKAGNIIIVCIEADGVLHLFSSPDVLRIILRFFDGIDDIGHSAIQFNMVNTRLGILDPTRRVIFLLNGLEKEFQIRPRQHLLSDDPVARRMGIARRIHR